MSAINRDLSAAEGSVIVEQPRSQDFSLSKGKSPGNEVDCRSAVKRE